MQVQVTDNHFETEAEAMAEIEAAGYHPLPFEDGPNEAAAHWHEFSSMVFILDGHLEVTDVETGDVYNCSRGSRLMAPADWLHAESSPGIKGIVGVSIPLDQVTEPINKPPK